MDPLDLLPNRVAEWVIVLVKVELTIPIFRCYIVAVFSRNSC